MLYDFKNKGQASISYFCRHQHILEDGRFNKNMKLFLMSKAKEQQQKSMNKWGKIWLYLAIITIGKTL